MRRSLRRRKSVLRALVARRLLINGVAWRSVAGSKSSGPAGASEGANQIVMILGPCVMSETPSDRVRIGRPIGPRSVSAHAMLHASPTNDMLHCRGPSGRHGLWELVIRYGKCARGYFASHQRLVPSRCPLQPVRRLPAAMSPPISTSSSLQHPILKATTSTSELRLQKARV